MMQRLTAWFPVLLLGAVAAVTVWLDRQVQPPEAGISGKGRHDPDYIVDNFTVVRIGPDGIVRYKLDARRMLHYPDDDTTDLVAPKFVNFQGPGVTVTASSKTAPWGAEMKSGASNASASSMQSRAWRRVRCPAFS